MLMSFLLSDPLPWAQPPDNPRDSSRNQHS